MKLQLRTTTALTASKMIECGEWMDHNALLEKDVLCTILTANIPFGGRLRMYANSWKNLRWQAIICNLTQTIEGISLRILVWFLICPLAQLTFRLLVLDTELFLDIRIRACCTHTHTTNWWLIWVFSITGMKFPPIQMDYQIPWWIITHGLPSLRGAGIAR